MFKHTYNADELIQKLTAEPTIRTWTARGLRFNLTAEGSLYGFMGESLEMPLLWIEGDWLDADDMEIIEAIGGCFSTLVRVQEIA